MVAPFYSASWYRVAALHPQLRAHLRVHVHRYRGKIWYILQDDLTGQSHRLAASAYIFAATMDGTRTLQDVWHEVSTRLGDAAPSQDEAIALLGQLHAADMLQTEIQPDAQELLRRFERKERQRFTQVILNPMSIKFPLWDPDAFIARTLPLVGWVFTRWGALLFLLVVGRAAVLAGEHWRDLIGGDLDRLLALDNLALLSIVFVLIKLIHELGHAYAIKAFGGEVHELGLMLLIFFPSPYVDASSSTGFRDKWQRMLVGSAGMLVELFVAALALGVWLAVAPGLVRAVAFNILVVSSVSTVVFNGNPLLRYDGYYILADLIEIPNLAARANAYWGYLADRYLLRVRAIEPPTASVAERCWFAGYAPLSFAYRMFVMINIALLVATKYLVVGVIIALWSLFGGVVLPVWRIGRSLLASGKYARERSRVVATAVGVTLGVLVVLAAVPFPLHSTSQGIVWLPESAIVRAHTDGFVTRQTVLAETQVVPGQPLVEAVDPQLSATVAVLQAQVDEANVRQTLDRETNRVDSRLTAIALAKLRSELAREQTRADGLSVASAAAGRLVLAKPQELVGGFVKRGDILAFVAPATSPIVRVTVEQEDIGLLRSGVTAIAVLPAGDTRRAYPATLIREVPGGTGELPSRALGDEGGGPVVTDPRDPQRTKAMSRRFQFDLRLPNDAPTAALGSRVYVRFEHRWEPIGWQLVRRVRQLLLSRLND